MRAITWASRATFANGRTAFVRDGGVTGRGRITNYRTSAEAETQAIALRKVLAAGDVVTVIERSHGRQFAEKR